MKALLFLILLSVPLFADHQSIIIKALKNEELNKEQRVELATLYLTQTDLFLKTLQGELPPNLQETRNILIKNLKSPPSEDAGVNRIGAAVGWFTQYKGEHLTSYPIISLLRKGSPAEQAKMKLGDVITAAEGVSLHGPSSRNKFINLTLIWPSSTPLNLEIKRNTRQPELDERILRDKKVKVTVTLSKKDFK